MDTPTCALAPYGFSHCESVSWFISSLNTQNKFKCVGFAGLRSPDCLAWPYLSQHRLVSEWYFWTFLNNYLSRFLKTLGLSCQLLYEGWGGQSQLSANETMTQLIYEPVADACKSCLFAIVLEELNLECLLIVLHATKANGKWLLTDWQPGSPCHLFVASFISFFPLRKSPWPWRHLCCLSWPCGGMKVSFLTPWVQWPMESPRCPLSWQPSLHSSSQQGKGWASHDFSFSPLTSEPKQTMIEMGRETICF